MASHSKASEELGRRFHQARLANDVTQQELAGLAGVNVANYARIERGRSNPTFDTILRLAAALGSPPGAFLDGISVDDLPPSRHTYSVEDFRRERAERRDAAG